MFKHYVCNVVLLGNLCIPRPVVVSIATVVFLIPIICSAFLAATVLGLLFYMDIIILGIKKKVAKIKG